MGTEYNLCFACGKDNPCGLKLQFVFEADDYVAYFVPRKEHQSYNDRVHGGIIATMLDEAMGDYVHKITGKQAVTARMEIRYRLGVPIEQTVKIVAKLVRKKGKLYEMKGELFLSDGQLAAESTGKVLLA